MEAVTALMVALAVANVALTVWHWGILRRARRYLKKSVREYDNARAMVEHAAELLPEAYATLDRRVTSNGKREPTEHLEGP